MKLLLIDNFDSFTYLISSIFEEFGSLVDVRRNEPNYLEEYDALIISPGPGSPENALVSLTILDKVKGKLPILGVCLGMQIILHIEGGKINKLTPPIHGKKANIYHSGEFIFKGLPSPFKGALYHSLGFYEVPENYKILARDERNVVMGIVHKELPIFGIQFHPESFLTENGKIIYKNFLNYVKKWKTQKSSYQEMDGVKI